MILGIFDLEKIENNHTVNPGCIPLTLLCDNVKDPGNMGSLLRCAAAVGCDQFITTKGNTKKNRYKFQMVINFCDLVRLCGCLGFQSVKVCCWCSL